MKKKIRINLFVSCPQNSEDLNEQKVNLVNRCTQIEKDYIKKDKIVEINTVTYGVPENRKTICEKYIRKSDIAIFLVDSEQDILLMEEIDSTVNRSKKFREPEIFVFFSDKAEGNKDYKTINKILDDGGWIPERYEDTKELLDKV